MVIMVIRVTGSVLETVDAVHMDHAVRCDMVIIAHVSGDIKGDPVEYYSLSGC